ncbi:MAG: hypothetical protein AAF226_03840 [Verrucomicrobiota bacterium]
MKTLFRPLIFSSLAIFMIGCATSGTSTGETVPATNRAKIQLSDADAKAIGDKIWTNECNHTIEGLTSWNQGEDFPSLGIGHFIWYVKGRPGPFDESFPSLLTYMKRQGVAVPRWLAEADGSPWKSRSEFLAQQNSPQMVELRKFLASTVSVQTNFIVERLEMALPKMKAATPNAADKTRLEKNFYGVASSRAGVYALIDYVNFKGEGTKATERYKGQGWGMRDVLLDMRPNVPPTVHEYSEAAKRVLTRRVMNSDPSRNENRWLAGWKNRCEGYKKGI